MNDENKTIMLSENELELVSEEEIAGSGESSKKPTAENDSEMSTQPPQPTPQRPSSIAPPPQPRARQKTIRQGDVGPPQSITTPKRKGDFVSTSAMTVAFPSQPTPSAPPSTPPAPPSTPPAPPSTPPQEEVRKSSPPELIDGRYEMGECLGMGAMGAVYNVRHVRLDKRFAMKIMHPELAKHKSTIARFQREAAALSRIDHPNCVGVTDFGQTPRGDFYLVMEKVEGTVLADIVDKGPLSIREAVETTKQVLMGLGHAHKAGILHRDIKLENLIRTENEDGTFTVKILDFGLAKDKNPENAESAITEAGIMLGTPQYIAPETILSQTMNQQTDLYAVGVTLFRMLTGEPLWQGEDLGEVLQAKVKNPTPRLNDAGKGQFPKALEDFLINALEEPQKRFADVTEMLNALEELSEELFHPKPRISVIAQTKIKPVTAAAVKYSLQATVFAFEQGKNMTSKIGSDVQGWLSRLPAESSFPRKALARVSELSRMLVAKLRGMHLLREKNPTKENKPESDPPPSTKDASKNNNAL